MFDIRNEEFVFAVSPLERVVDEEADPVNHLWDWIKSFVELSVNGVKVQFQTEFTVGELKELREHFASFYEAVKVQREIKPFNFRSDLNQLNMLLRKVEGDDIVIIEYVLRPESHADSVQVKGEFGINESYFPDIFRRLDEMIAWPE
ncbi:WapI family immunity protein [Candidatus Pantoea formicae]|uniref:WapI family immunity protein n=1 Tax=Candidatus Pantoea formicae TaxID=2608355 RepID=UPI003ED883F9